jgi:spermidine/putrescine transport system permease protein
VLATTTSLLCVIVAVPVAYYIATLPKRRQPKMLLFVVIPLWSSFLVRIFAWKVLLHPEGPVKSLLLSLHLVNESTSLLYNNPTVLLVMCTSYLPFAILPIYSAASKFNFQLFEAALDLGATKRQAFFYIFLPVIRPAMLTASLLVLIPAAGAYVIPEVVGGKGTAMLGNMIAQRVFVDRNLPDASAIALLLSIVILIPAVIITFWKESFQNLRQKRGV